MSKFVVDGKVHENAVRANYIDGALLLWDDENRLLAGFASGAWGVFAWVSDAEPEPEVENPEPLTYEQVLALPKNTVVKPIDLETQYIRKGNGAVQSRYSNGKQRHPDLWATNDFQWDYAYRPDARFEVVTE